MAGWELKYIQCYYRAQCYCLLQCTTDGLAVAVDHVANTYNRRNSSYDNYAGIIFIYLLF